MRVEDRQRTEEEGERRSVVAVILAVATVPRTVLAAMIPTTGMTALDVAPIGPEVTPMGLDVTPTGLDVVATMALPASCVRGAGDGRRRDQGYDGDGNT